MRITTDTLSDNTLAVSTQYTSVPEHDVQEIVARFSRPEPFNRPDSRQIVRESSERSVRSIGSILSQKSATSDFNAATQGGITFRRIDPLRETNVVADARLQQRLESLCQTLRAKY